MPSRNARFSRGQIFSSDFLMAWFVFLSAMLLGIAFFTRIESTPLNQWDDFQQELARQQSFAGLLQTPGYPSNWDAQNPPTVWGLTHEPFVLSATKLTSFSEWWVTDANAVKRAAGLTQDELMRLRVVSRTGEELFASGDSPSLSTALTRYQAFAVLDGEWCTVFWEVWS